LAGLTLLENAEGSNLVIAAAHGNNIVKVIQKGLQPLNRMLGGKFEKGAASAHEARAVVGSDNVVCSIAKEDDQLKTGAAAKQDMAV